MLGKLGTWPTYGFKHLVSPALAGRKAAPTRTLHRAFPLHIHPPGLPACLQCTLNILVGALQQKRKGVAGGGEATGRPAAS